MSEMSWDDMSFPSLTVQEEPQEAQDGAQEQKEEQEPQTEAKGTGLFRSNVQALIQLCDDLGVEVFQDKERGDWFVRFPSRGRKIIERLRSEGFKSWLSSKFYQAQGTAPNRSNLEDAFSVLTGLAQYGPEEPITAQKVFLRLASVSDKFYLDLNNEALQVVEVDASGWRVLDECSLWFWRPFSMGALPVPVMGGDLSELRPFVNAAEEDFILICGWLLAALHPDVEYPILTLTSEAGSGKSTLTRFLKELVDPDNVGPVAPPKNLEALCAAASSRHVVAMDNLTKLNTEDGDHLCRLATGAGIIQRKLYTNGETYEVRLRRPLILNGIASVSDKADLIDRCFPVGLLPLNEGRRENLELEREFEAARPRILGALLTAVSAALRSHDGPHKQVKRMASAVSFIMRAAGSGAMSFGPDDFDRALTIKTQEAMLETAMDSPVGLTVFNLAEEHSYTTAPLIRTPEELLKEVQERGEKMGCGRSVLPQTVRGLGRILAGLVPALRACGVEVVSRRTKERRFWEIRRTSQEGR